ncbi:cardiolipin synthase [Fulvimarina endophytica]|uniref:Cardiolipin synthase n=1 Tax=Fulvimarina endophytica TaxID=2293836 RepID=A0A371X8L5_9HYPH|nr:cardiolipin synthase [Fulvimarina endophytica]RFC65414.1 cardiolipin synthase [Fulvimarina endophytica]
MFDISSLTLAYLLAEWVVRLVMILVIPQRRAPEAARSWLLLFLFVPIPALIVYRMIGRARFPAWRRRRFASTGDARSAVAERLAGGAAAPLDAKPLARLARTLGGFPVTGGNRIELTADYEDAVRLMVRDIDAATSRVHLLTYIFADDRTGRAIAEALGRARRRGVEVRVLVDALGSHQWAARTMDLLASLDVDARLVLPVRLASLRRTRGDLRNHRKLCLIDGRAGFVGSQNIVDRDFKPGIVNDELVARVEGPVVMALDTVFACDWYLETEVWLAPLDVAGRPGEANLQAMPSGPDFDVPGYERLLVEMVHGARRRVRIVSPYLIPDESLLVAMKNAVARGVEVDLIVSALADQRLVSLAQHSYYDELLSAGIGIHQYRERLLHAKNVLVDDRVGIVGSSNADVRSFMLNAEISLILHDEAACRSLGRIHDLYIGRSDPLTLQDWRGRSRISRVLENGARMVSPLL